MEKNDIDKPVWRPTNPHDRFCRHTAFHPLYAPDLLKSYGDAVLRKYVDLDHLEEAPTTHLSEELKEVIMDASLTTRLLNTRSMSEVLLHLEHKSRPSRTVALQLIMEVALSLHCRWISSNRTESKSFVPPVPLMIVLYNGDEDWDGEIWFQDLFPDLPEELRPFVPQFRVFVINLRRFKYGSLPGRPETQAIVESLMRATDGTFIEQLPSVLQHVAEAELDGRLRLDLTRNVSTYCAWSSGATTEQIAKAIKAAFKGQEGIKMAEIIPNSIIQEGIEIGEARGEVKGELKSKVEDIIAVLHTRFHHVPFEVNEAICKMNDLTALASLLQYAVTCVSIDDFAKSLE